MSLLMHQAGMMSAASGPTGYQAAVLALLPAAYWRLNETSGTSATDLSGNGHTGTYVGAVTLGSSSLLPGGNGKSITKTGTGKVTFFGLNATNKPFTVMAWVKRSSAPATSQVIFSAGISGGIQLAIDSTGRILCGASGNFNLAQGTAILTVGTAYLVAITCDASGNYKYYLNNTVDKTGSGAATFGSATSGGFIGVYPVSDQFPFLGQIQDLALFTTELSGTDISALYAAASIP